MKFSWCRAQHPRNPSLPPKGGSVGSLLKGQCCFPRGTIRREAMSSHILPCSLPAPAPASCGTLLLWPMFVRASGWVEKVGGTAASHRSVHQQPEWVILNRKLPTAQRERFMLVPSDLLRPECRPSTHPLPARPLQFSSPTYTGTFLCSGQCEYPCSGRCEGGM